MTTVRVLPDGWQRGPDIGAVADDRRCACVARGVRATSDRVEVTSPDVAASLVAPELSGRDREACLALLLDTRHRLLHVVTVSVGSIDHTFMSPREVFRDALLGNAAAVVVAHNHPSGDAEPSRDDVAVTGRLVRAGELLGVPLLDHLVIGGSRWTSLARRGEC